MKLFYAPGACSMGIHVILEEIGQPFEAQALKLMEGEQHKPPFSEINPKGKVPTLQRDDGSVVTEFPVIAHMLGEQHGLIPADKEAALRAAEAMDYCVATIHMQGFSRLFRPGNFTPNEADHDKVKAQGRGVVDKAFALMDQQLEGKEWVAGSYSVADAALFYVEYWGGKRMGMPLPKNLAAHLERMLARPAVQRMIAKEGLAA